MEVYLGIVILARTYFRVSAIAIWLIIWSFCAHAQSETQNLPTDEKQDRKEIGKFEVGVNITAALRNFVGNEGTISAGDFPLLLRFHGEKHAFRLGVGFAIQNQDFIDQITFVTRNSNLTSYFLKVGFERKIFTEKRLSFYYGIDLIGIYEVDRVTVPTFENFELKKEITTYGISPFLGFSFKLNKYMRLHTEASTNIFYETSVTEEVFDGTSEQISSENALFGEVQVPIFLYLNVRF